MNELPIDGPCRPKILQAADLAPAQLEALRPNVVLDSRAACPVSGASASSGRGCPFRRPMVEGAPLLEKVGGTEEIEKILTLMEREVGDIADRLL